MSEYSKAETQLIVSQLDSIKLNSVKAAYIFLISDAKQRSSYDVKPGGHGDVSDFRYYVNGEFRFAFIPNRKSLLWYFRVPALNSMSLNMEALEADFSEVRETNANEVTVRICDYDDAKRITTFLI